MSVNYGGPPAGGMPYGGGAAYAPPGKVNFGWISEAFSLFQANIGVWIIAGLLSLVPLVFAFVIGAIAGASGAATTSAYQGVPSTNPGAEFAQRLGGGGNPAVSLLIQIVAVVYRAWLYGGVYRAAVKQVRGESISTADLFAGGSTILPMLIYNIVYSLAVGIGSVLCVVPGLLALGLLFPGFALIADGENFGNALSRSIDGMKKDMWMAAAFAFVMGLLIAVSAIPCGLGLFVTVPMFYLVGALAYRDMIGMPTGAGGFGQPGFGAPAAPGVWPPAPSAVPPPTEPPTVYGQTPPPTSFGQAAPPAPSWGQPQPPVTPPANPEPPRRSLGGDPVDETPPSGGGPQ